MRLELQFATVAAIVFAASAVSTLQIGAAHAASKQKIDDGALDCIEIWSEGSDKGWYHLTAVNNCSVAVAFGWIDARGRHVGNVHGNGIGTYETWGKSYIKLYKVCGNDARCVDSLWRWEQNEL